LLEITTIVIIKAIAIIVTATSAEKSKNTNCNNILSIISITSYVRGNHTSAFSLFSNQLYNKMPNMSIQKDKTIILKQLK